MYGFRAPQGAQYYCRGCGEKLPPDCHAQFHPACLKADICGARKRDGSSNKKDFWLGSAGARWLASHPPSLLHRLGLILKIFVFVFSFVPGLAL